MKEKLLIFFLLAILSAYAYHLALGWFYARFFSETMGFQVYWYIPFLAVPALLLLGLAWWMGFGRPGGSRGLDTIVLLAIAGIVYLTLDASYACGTGCF